MSLLAVLWITAAFQRCRAGRFWRKLLAGRFAAACAALQSIGAGSRAVAVNHHDFTVDCNLLHVERLLDIGRISKFNVRISLPNQSATN